MAKVEWTQNQWYISSSGNTSSGNVINIPQARKENYGVYTGGDCFAVCATREEAEQVIEGMTYMNRWANGKGEVAEIHGTVSAVTDPLARFWHCYWQAGRMGWDATPYDNRRGMVEGVRSNHSNEKSVLVYAETAILAIEKAKFMLIMQGKETT